jgi:import inner membrane translocase subunit TIM21
LGERVKENVKTTSYLGVIILGVSVTAIMFYSIFSELFSSSSPQQIYSDAFEKCKNDTRVQDALGQPIKAYGEESRRRRRTHISHQAYLRDGINHMRVTFHIQGIRNKAIVQCDMRENDKGKYDYRYLLVQLENYPHTTVVIEDNRALDGLTSVATSIDSGSQKPLTGIFS